MILDFINTLALKTLTVQQNMDDCEMFLTHIQIIHSYMAANIPIQ